jgi:hypothetical protein
VSADDPQPPEVGPAPVVPAIEIEWAPDADAEVAEVGLETALTETIADVGIRDVKTSIAFYRETTRSVLAKWLMFLVTLVIVGLLVLAGLQMAGTIKATVSILDLATGVLTPVVTLAGTALGFYFGAQTATESTADEVAAREKGWIRKTWEKVW